MYVGIGIPEIVFVLALIGVPIWLARGFPPSNRVARYALACALGVLFAVIVFNLATTFRPVN